MNLGFNADPDIVPNLDSFTEMMKRSLARVAREAGVSLPEPTKAVAALDPAKQAAKPARVNGKRPAAVE